MKLEAARCRRRPRAARQRDGDRVATWLENELDRAADAHVNPGRTAEFHRLNRSTPMRFATFLGWKSTRRPCCARRTGVPIRQQRRRPVDAAALLDRYTCRRGEDCAACRRRSERFQRVRALHRAERQLERDHMAVAERAERISARVARRDRSAPIFRWTAITSSRFGWTALTPASSEACARTGIEVRIDGVRVGQLSVGGTPGSPPEMRTPGSGTANQGPAGECR